MNSVQQREGIDFYLDRSRSARFSLFQYAVAMRETQNIYFDTFKTKEQGIRENLFTLIKTTTPAITTLTTTATYTINHFNLPTDYHFFTSLFCYIDGVLVKTKSTNYNMFNDVLLDSFRKPTNSKMYQLEDATGWKLSRGVGGTLTVEFTYLQAPSDWSIGTEADLISAGALVLTNGVSYTATSLVVQNAINYNPGDQFNAVGSALTSGQVILTSKLTNSNLPFTVHEDLCEKCASLLLGTTKDLIASQFAEKIYVESSGAK